VNLGERERRGTVTVNQSTNTEITRDVPDSDLPDTGYLTVQLLEVTTSISLYFTLEFCHWRETCKDKLVYTFITLRNTVEKLSLLYQVFYWTKHQLKPKKAIAYSSQTLHKQSNSLIVTNKNQKLWYISIMSWTRSYLGKFAGCSHWYLLLLIKKW